MLNDSQTLQARGHPMKVLSEHLKRFSFPVFPTFPLDSHHTTEHFGAHCALHSVPDIQ